MGRNKTITLGLLMLIFSFISGCGYSLKSTLPLGTRYIYVTPFKNKIDISQEDNDYERYKSYKPLLETDITKSVIDAFISDGNLRVASNPRNADIILIGGLIGFVRQPIQYFNEERDVKEYRLNVIVSLVLKNKKDDIMWEEKNFVGESKYKTENTSETAALDAAVKDLAKRIVERVIEDW